MEIKKIDKKNPRLALLVDAWFPLYGGGQVHVAEIARQLAEKHNYDVEIITRKISGRSGSYERELVSHPRIKVREFGFKSKFKNPIMRVYYMVATFVYLLIRNSSEKKFDIYHAHAVSSAVPMKMASWITGVPTMLTVHGTTIFRRGWNFKKIIERVMFLETKYSHEISVAENFLKANNVNNNVSIIPNGIDLARFDEVKIEKTPGTFDALFVGRLEYIKGLDNLMYAVKNVVESVEFIQSHKDFVLNLVGEGDDRKSLEKLVETLEIEKHVKFLGKISGQPLVELYKGADLFVLPSRSEGFPLTLLEACAAKLPILATDVGDNKKIVTEKVNGHLVYPDDIEELTYYLEYFAVNPYLKQMGEAGYQIVKKEFTWEAIAEKTVHIYEKCLRERINKKNITYSRFYSLLTDPRMPWFVPKVLVQRKLYEDKYKGKTPLKFCVTVDVEQSYGSGSFPHESEHIPAFLERFSDMCSSLEIPSTLFVQADQIPAYTQELKAMEDSGHEIGIHGLHHELWGKEKWFLKDKFVAPLERKKLLKKIWDIIGNAGLKNVMSFRAPNLVIDKTSVELIRESGFQIDSSTAVMIGRKPLPRIKGGLCRVPVSRDPMPQLQWRYGLPFGNYIVMNLANFLKLSDEELLEAVNRLREYHKKNKVDPHLVFLCHSWEFQSSDYVDYASGENFTVLSKKIAMLKDHMDLEFMTITNLCTKLYADS